MKFNRILAALVLAPVLATTAAACGKDGSSNPTGVGAGDDTGGLEPGQNPDAPGTTPDDPGTTPADPGTTPDDPGTTPDDPGTTPDDPGTTPGDPGTTPGDPGTTPEPTPETGADRFGVTMLYPSKAGGESWALADDATSDKRFDPQNTITKNSDGSWKMRSDKVRMQVSTSTGYDASKIATYDRDTLAAQGYMQAPNDWKNVEVTGFVKTNAVNASDDNFAWYARGGRHTDGGQECEGSAYKGDLYYDGRTRFAKESWHVSYDYTPYQTATTSIMGRWVGYKAVIHNVEQNGKTAVKLEVWLNDNADKVTWKKVLEKIDDGNWAGDASSCGASAPKMPITWGGPLATFRWDSATDVDFKWLSVREIQ